MQEGKGEIAQTVLCRLLLTVLKNLSFLCPQNRLCPDISEIQCEMQCEMQIFLIVLVLRLCTENYSIPQETEQGGSEHKQLCLKVVFSGAYVKICPLSENIGGFQPS